MLHYSIVKDNSGTAISTYSVGTISTIVTESIATERHKGMQGLLFVIAGGTIADVQRQVSFDNTNFYDVYDSNGTNLTNLSTNVTNSRFLVVNNIDSSNVVANFTRFKFVGTGSIATLTALYYVHEE